ncbi:uncharacterized protein NPIL_423741, partial [Nephila pilipes]
MPRSRKVFKKRKGTFFKGRNITSSSNSTLDADVSNNDIKTDIKNPCAKERKIPDLNASFSTFEGNIGVINAIMNLNILSFVFKNDVRCKKCDNGMDMQVLKNNSGLAISFVLKCCVCPYRVEFSSSDYHEGTQRATVNTRYVYAMRSIGRGAEAGRMFCALMNLPQPPTRFAPYNKRLLNAVKLVSEETMQKATQEAVLENGSNNNIAVAVDGTWQKRVFTLEVEQVKRLEFPAVSICNFNRMRKFVLSRDAPLLLSERSSSFYCNAANDSERDEIKESLQQFYEMDEEWRWRKGHKPSDFMQKCLFHSRFCPRNRLSYFQNLRYGNCITFNKLNKEMETLAVSDVGPNTGLILELNLQSFFYHPSTKALGARVVIHLPNETPNPEDQGFNAN